MIPSYCTTNFYKAHPKNTVVDLVANKTYEEKASMRNNLIAYKITRYGTSFIGTHKDIAEIVEVSPSTISGKSLNHSYIHGWILERVGLYKKVFKVYKDGQLYFTGHSEDVAKELGITELRIAQVADYETVIKKHYKIVHGNEYELVEMKI